MSIAQIEAELKRLTADELRRLAVSSWEAFVEKEGEASSANESDETDPALLAALDDAVRSCDQTGSRRSSGDEIRSRIRAMIPAR